MSQNMNWSEDTEALGIALKLAQKFTDLFAGLDLTKIRFVRNLSMYMKKVGEIRACNFPYNIDSPYAYYIVISNRQWKQLSEAQKILSVMHLLYAIAPNGTNEQSNNYAKLRKHDVEDFNVILAAAGGRYDWMTPGVQGILNPLKDSSSTPEKQ